MCGTSSSNNNNNQVVSRLTSEPFRGLCRYKSGKCRNERAKKRNGMPHTLCDHHRTRQNAHQRKSDRKNRETFTSRRQMQREYQEISFGKLRSLTTPNTMLPRLPPLRDIVRLTGVLSPSTQRLDYARAEGVSSLRQITW